MAVQVKVALVDTVMAGFEDEMLRHVAEVVDPARIDYVVANHGEPDHSGAIPAIAVAEALPRAASDSAARQTILDNLTRYVQLLRDHIYKEDHILYPMADQLLLPDDQRALEESFERAEREEIGEGVHERYHRIAHELQTPEV